MTATLPLSGGSGEKKWTLSDGIAEVKREIGLRQRVYPQFVARQSMSQHEADAHMKAMEGVLKFLQFCGNNEVRLRSFFAEGGFN